MDTGSFPGDRAAGAWRWPPTPSSAEVEGRVKLYIYSPSGPSWPALGWALPLPLLNLVYFNAYILKKQIKANRIVINYRGINMFICPLCSGLLLWHPVALQVVVIGHEAYSFLIQVNTDEFRRCFNPLNAELNPIRHLLALVGTRHIVHVSRIRVN